MPTRPRRLDLHYLSVVPRRTLIIGYGVAAIVILLIEACYFLSEFILRFEVPYFDFRNIPTTVLFAAIICIGLCCARFRPRYFPLFGLMVAYVTFAYATGSLIATVLMSWLDFTSRQDGSRALNFSMQDKLESFFNAHPPWSPFGFGFWAALTPFAFFVLVILSPFVPGLRKRCPNVGRCLALMILAIAIPITSFVSGSLLAEHRVPRGLIGGSDVVVSLLPVVILGALSAFVVLSLSASKTEGLLSTSQPSSKVDFSKVIASASQLSVVALILLYLSISQISGYATNISELIQLRRAFASDILHTYAPADDVLNASTTEGNGEVKRWTLVPSVPWATVEVAKYEADHDWYRIEVQEALSNEKWSARAHRINDYPGGNTQTMADREGVSYSSSDTAVSIYPKVEAQLRSKQVAFPGVGFSLDLSSFTLVAPFVLFAVFVLLGERARIAVNCLAVPDDPWILLDGRSGLSGLLALLWLAALAIGPWVLAVVLVQVISLLLRTKGDFENFAIDGLATAYVTLALIILLVPAALAVLRLLLLRQLKHV